MKGREGEREKGKKETSAFICQENCNQLQKHIINIVLSTAPNTGAREILITEIMHFSAQNHTVALHLTIRSQALDICATSHCVSLVRLELLLPEASILNGSETELDKEKSVQDLEGRNTTVTL